MTESSGAPADAPPQCYRHPGRETYIRCQRCERPICPDCMNQASVGFHCPECVAEGRKSVRPPRTVAGGLVPTKVGAATMGLIAINVVVFIVVVASGGRSSSMFIDLAMLPSQVLDPVTGTVADGVAQGEYWRLLTAAFLHLEIWHILLNMYALWLFGPLLERMLGYVRFLALYLTSGVAGSVAVYWLAPANSLGLGASGAVFGLFGAALVLLHKQRYDVTALLVLLGINVVLSFTLSFVSWQAHLGGLVAGGLLGAVLGYAPRRHRTLVQAAAFGVVWVVLVVTVVARTAALT